jgi:PAS domain S-box-containing protein
MAYTIGVTQASRPAVERRNLALRDATLVQALTTTDRLAELLPLLHYRAIAAVGGRSSVVFQFDRGGDGLRATSAFGIEQLPTDSWPSSSLPEPLFRDANPMFVQDITRVIRGVGDYLNASSAVLVPLVQMRDPIGVLLVGCAQPVSQEQLQEVASVGHAFVIAIERLRAARDLEPQRDLRSLIQEFSRTVSSRLNLALGLETLCARANRLFSAERTSVWLHDRRARMLVLSASSDVMYLAQEQRMSTADSRAPAAIALRLERSDLSPSGAAAISGRHTRRLTIPLKGRRRALGTLVVDEVRLEPRGEIELLDRADEMGRQLSSAIENVLLLDDVLRSRRELENTFNSLVDLVAVCDQDGRLVNVNRAFVNRVGKPRQELMDRPLSEIVGPGTYELLEQVQKRGPEPFSRDEGQTKVPAPFSAEIEDTRLSGTFLVTVTPLLGEGQDPIGAVVVARDVTPHAQLEAERAELRNRLVQSEKLAALGEFVAGIAHELNNPLQGVLGHLELMRATGVFPKELRRDMQRIYREADRAAKIVRNLLVFAGSRRLVRRRTSVNATLSRVLALRAPAFRGAGIEVVRRHDEGLPRVKGDPLLLHQALLNIMIKAEQAIGASGGRIETRTGLIQHKGQPHIVVEIRDTGPGIPPTVLPRVFEPFYTTKEVGKGTGLGLAIAYGIIQEHGGQIVASNHPEGGAIFTVQLPVEKTGNIV